MANSPYLEYLGLTCAIEELSEQHADAERYGQAAILSALAKRMEVFHRAIECVEDLVLAQNDAAKERVVTRLTEWAGPWRMNPDKG